jgi:hypothetical protein
MNVLTGLVSKITGWIDRLFGFGDYYTSGYSKYIVYAGLIFVLSKMLKVKIDYKTGGN